MGDHVADRGRDVQKANALRRLQRLAPEAGGRVIRLVGNHELMRAEGSLRDAHPAESSAAAVAGVMQWKVDVKSGAVRASYSDGPYFFTHAGVRPALLERSPDVVDRRTRELPQRPPPRRRRRPTRTPSAADTSNAPVASRTTFSRPASTAAAAGVGGTFWTDWRIAKAPRPRRCPTPSRSSATRPRGADRGAGAPASRSTN